MAVVETGSSQVRTVLRKRPHLRSLLDALRPEGRRGHTRFADTRSDRPATDTLEVLDG